MTRHHHTPRRRVHRFAVSAVALTVLLTVLAPAPAMAAEYPSWEDVEAARSSETSKQAQIGEITALLTELRDNADTARSTQDARVADYEKAQATLDDATYRADELQADADEATTLAEQSRKQAGQLASTLSRAGGTNLTLALLTSPDSGSLLDQLASMTKLTEKTDAIYTTARTDSNTATALTAQAEIARDTLADLAAAADVAHADAIAAREAADTRVQEQQDYESTLRSQLAVLTENRAATEADYQTGEDARRTAEAARAAEEAARIAAQAEAARIAEAARAAAPASSTPAGDTAPASGGAPVSGPSSQGWVKPVSGRISSPFGPRPQQPVAGVNPFHYATDIVASCGTPVAAASNGTVSYSGAFGSYGNWVLLDHGNGIQTGYAHNSTLLVDAGQTVTAGQIIALVGTTGASTGCHSHYETRTGGARVDPEPFMRARGVTLG
ncbi:peptidoglycan DD-metalloendopeptidase family protein [Rathayibacter caricis]|uniref:M23 family metallopeptidase n=1 Tax=Rathayibacter caricis TaxID=110936 RepID=UPI001FB27C48|nr:M23 family metallopeptidase [Rathayibacter caricis]MCJ1697698.1 peptidoglycan DD-metalloendopeptidase family protein [Rathayibacter caricis]